MVKTQPQTTSATEATGCWWFEATTEVNRETFPSSFLHQKCLLQRNRPRRTGSGPPRTGGRVSALTLLSSWSCAVRSATCCLTCLCSVVSFSSFSFILFRVCIISSFSWVLASHSLSFFSSFCCSSLCSVRESGTGKQSSEMEHLL